MRALGEALAAVCSASGGDGGDGGGDDAGSVASSSESSCFAATMPIKQASSSASTFTQAWYLQR